jgi:hypothetical protein
MTNQQQVGCRIIRTPENVARAWTIMFSIISGITIRDKIPKKWMDFCKEAINREPPSTFSDKYERQINNVERENITMGIEQRITEIKTKIFPIHSAQL